MRKSSYINRPKEDEPTYFDRWSEHEVEWHLDTLDLQLFRGERTQLISQFNPAPAAAKLRAF